MFEGLIASGERSATTLERCRIQYRNYIEPIFTDHEIPAEKDGNVFKGDPSVEAM
jgi:hypothetical protein